MGGWLILIIAGLFITILRQALIIYDQITLPYGMSAFTLSGTFVPGYVSALQIAVEMLFFSFAICLVFLFFQKNRKFPKYYIIFLIVSVAYVILGYLSLYCLANQLNEVKRIIDETLYGQIMELVRMVLVAVVWILYMMKSKRVKATFTKS